MSRQSLQYSHAFDPAKEPEVAARINQTATAMFKERLGEALDTGIQAMQLIVSRHYRGDSEITIQDAMRAAREMRQLMNEKAALWRLCRAEAIELLGLRPRPAEKPAAAPKKLDREALDRIMAQNRKVAEEIVKTTGAEGANGPDVAGELDPQAHPAGQRDVA